MLLPLGPDSKGNPQPPAKVVCWLPEGITNVRGVVVAHPMIWTVATGPAFRKVAVDEGLGMIKSGEVFATTGKETMERLDKVFDDWAVQSKHPEIRGAAVLTAGLSTSVLWARNVGYAAPDRCFGIIHVAGGNLHQFMNDERKTLSGVPFIAMNGQFEAFGPEGGIRPHLGFETQWYLMGDTMLERRKQDPNNLMSLVVVPVKGHTAYSQALAALFLRKAAHYRLPNEKRDGTTPTKCIPIKAEDGWLTDRDVKYPKHEPAAYADYTGDKSQAFWHFDKEMALAVCQYHKDGIREWQERSVFRPAGLMEQLWPLGPKMDIPFTGWTRSEQPAVLAAWIGKKIGMDPAAPVVGKLAEGIAAGLKKNGDSVNEGSCHDMVARVSYAYDDTYLPIAATIEKSALAPAVKDALRAYYADALLVRLPNGQAKPNIPIRALQARIAALPATTAVADIDAWLQDAAADRAALAVLYGPAPAERPATLDKLLADLGVKDSTVGWAKVDELVKLGAPAIPDLVRLMDYGGQPKDFRAAAALGKMGKVAACALPDLRRWAERGSRLSEMDGMINVTALEAIDQIVEDGG
ncbi:MAG: hypothetical protein WCJ56_02960 [bacterium]